jgi:hypothetical protein
MKMLRRQQLFSETAQHFHHWKSELLAHSADALRADVLAFVIDDSGRVVTEDASRMILPKDHRLSLDKDLDAVFLFDAKRTAQFDRQYNAAQFVDFTNDASRFHFAPPLTGCNKKRQLIAVFPSYLHISIIATIMEKSTIYATFCGKCEIK